MAKVCILSYQLRQSVCKILVKSEHPTWRRLYIWREITLISEIDFFLIFKAFFLNTKWKKYFFHKTLWEFTSIPSFWAFKDYYRPFLSQDMALLRHFSLIGKTAFFFIILKLHISIHHPKYKHPYLKYENWHQDIQFDPL